MPSLSAHSPALMQGGPCLDVLVAPSTVMKQSVPQGTTIPAPVTVVAMIDTGATGTVITPDVAQRLGLSPTGARPISGVNSQARIAPTYHIDLLIPANRIVIPNRTVVAADLTGQHIQALIGRDILAHAVFIYVGYDNRWTLSF